MQKEAAIPGEASPLETVQFLAEKFIKYAKETLLHEGDSEHIKLFEQVRANPSIKTGAGDFCRWVGCKLVESGLNKKSTAEEAHHFIESNPSLKNGSGPLEETFIHDIFMSPAKVLSVLQNSINAKMTVSIMKDKVSVLIEKAIGELTPDEIKSFLNDVKLLDGQPELDSESENGFENGSMRWVAVTNEDGEYVSGSRIEGKVGGHCGNGAGEVTSQPSLLSLRNTKGFQGSNGKNVYATVTVHEGHIQEAKGNGNRPADLNNPGIKSAFQWLYLNRSDIKGYQGGGYLPLSNASPLKVFDHDVKGIQDLEKKHGKNLLTDKDVKFLELKNGLADGSIPRESLYQLSNGPYWDALGVKPEELKDTLINKSAMDVYTFGSKYITEDVLNTSLKTQDFIPLAIWSETNLKMPPGFLDIFIARFKSGKIHFPQFQGSSDVKKAISLKIESLGSRKLTSESLAADPTNLHLFDPESPDVVKAYSKGLTHNPSSIDRWKGSYPDEVIKGFSEGLQRYPGSIDYYKGDLDQGIIDCFSKGLEKQPIYISKWKGPITKEIRAGYCKGLERDPAYVNNWRGEIDLETDKDIVSGFSNGLRRKPAGIASWKGSYTDEIREGFAEGLKTDPSAIREYKGVYTKSIIASFTIGLEKDPYALNYWNSELSQGLVEGYRKGLSEYNKSKKDDWDYHDDLDEKIRAKFPNIDDFAAGATKKASNLRISMARNARMSFIN